jgi:hypothetical protein
MIRITEQQLLMKCQEALASNQLELFMQDVFPDVLETLSSYEKEKAFRDLKIVELEAEIEELKLNAS